MKIKEKISKYKETETSARKTLIKGATVLGVAGIIGKVLGACFRIPLTNLIGAEGMAYYGAAYPVYSFFLILATAGFPVAISRMVSERIAIGDYRNANRAYKVSLLLMLGIGVLSFGFCFFYSDRIAISMNNEGADYSIRAIAPALLFAPVVASFRGYYQGHQNMLPTAVSEVVEQFVRVFVGLSLSFLLIDNSLEAAAAGATFGAAAGLIASLIVLGAIYFITKIIRHERITKSIKREESTNHLLKELGGIAIPITLGSTIMPLMMIIDSVIIMNRLQAAGYDYKMAKTLYGLISGFSDPLIAFPGVFIDAVCISLIPAITRAFTLRRSKDLRENISSGIKTMMVIAYPCAIGLIILSKPILTLLYPSRIDEAIMAVPNLQILSIGIITLSTMRIFSSTLQGLGKMMIPVYNLGLSAVVKIIITYILVGIPSLNINGAAIGTVLAYLMSAILNYKAVKEYANVSLDLSDIFAKPLAASIVMGAAALVIYQLIFAITGHNSIGVLLTIIAAVLIYFIMIFKTKALKPEDLQFIPKGDLIQKLAQKLKLI